MMEPECRKGVMFKLSGFYFNLNRVQGALNPRRLSELLLRMRESKGTGVCCNQL